MSPNKARESIVVVTGASRGAGKGIALALGATGSTVYVTGRTTQIRTAPLPGTVCETAEEITRAGARSTFVASWHVAPLPIASAGGVVVNTSGFGGGCYMQGPAYGAAKAAIIG
jgi:NAD(P)-dependent dehydrogenase (short-subunit alcohol dehydrogenase family)